MSRKNTLNKCEILGLLNELPLLDKDEFWVMTGASLVLQNIIEETHDLDLGVSPKQFAKVKECYGSLIDDNGQEYIQYRSNVSLYPVKQPDSLGEVHGYNVQKVHDIQHYYFQRGLKKDYKKLEKIDKYLRDRGISSEVRFTHRYTEIDVGRIAAVGTIVFGTICTIGGIKNRKKMDLDPKIRKRSNIIGGATIAALTALTAGRLWNAGYTYKTKGKHTERAIPSNNHKTEYSYGKVIRITRCEDVHSEIFKCDIETEEDIIVHYESTANEKVKIGDRVGILFDANSRTGINLDLMK